MAPKVKMYDLEYFYVYNGMDRVCSRCDRRNGEHYLSSVEDKVLYCDHPDDLVNYGRKFVHSGLLRRRNEFGYFGKYEIGCGVKLPHANPNAAFEFRKRVRGRR